MVVAVLGPDALQEADHPLPVRLVLERPLRIAQEDAQRRLIFAPARVLFRWLRRAGEGRPRVEPGAEAIGQPSGRDVPRVAPQQWRARLELKKVGG